jgi:cytoskeletal protein RodZ
MSDDVFEAFGDDDIFAEEEEQEQPEGEGQNRTFIIAVAVLGGLLLCALASFGVWALVLNKPQEAAPAPTEMVATPTMEEVVVETDTPMPTETPSATDTPEPTATPLLGPTATPTPDEEEMEGEEGALAQTPAEGEEDVEPTATTVTRRTATPTATPRPTSTPRAEASSGGTGFGESTGELSQTGLGEWLLVGAALLFVGVMIVARRLRTT